MPRRLQRAFTIMEVMMATFVFTVGILGVYAMMIKSYKMVTLSRHRDNGRAILVSFADEFLRLQTNDNGITRSMFVPNAASSKGLIWTNPNGVSENGDSQGSPALGVKVMLGDNGINGQGSPVEARVFREMHYLDSAGNPLADTVTDQTTVLTAAGYLMQATFTIQYTYNGEVQHQDITVVRSAR